MNKFSTKMLARAGIIAALYAALTLTLPALSFNSILQFRPAEALTLLPLLYSDSIIGLFIGCFIANLLSPYGVPDLVVGSLATLVAAVCTFFTGKMIKNQKLKVFVGGLFPVLVNAIFLPLMWYLMDSKAGYWASFGSMLLTQAIYVYVLGIPFYMLLKRLQSSGVAILQETLSGSDTQFTKGQKALAFVCAIVPVFGVVLTLKTKKDFKNALACAPCDDADQTADTVVLAANKTTCELGSFYGTATAICAFLWTIVIAFVIYAVMVKQGYAAPPFFMQ